MPQRCGDSAPWPFRRPGPSCWICPQANGHLQATGRDRKAQAVPLPPAMAQVRDEIEVRAHARLRQGLPQIRQRSSGARAARPAARKGAGDRRAPAGSDDDADRERGIRAAPTSSYGLTTLRTATSRSTARQIEFRFRGKSGVFQHDRLQRPAPGAASSRACHELPGQELFQYLDDDGERARSTRPTSTTTCATSPARSTRRRTSAPGRAPCWRRWRCRNSSSSTPRRRQRRTSCAAIERCRRKARQHADHLPQVLCASGGARLLPQWRIGAGDRSRGPGGTARKALAGCSQGSRCAGAAARSAPAHG